MRSPIFTTTMVFLGLSFLVSGCSTPSTSGTLQSSNTQQTGTYTSTNTLTGTSNDMETQDGQVSTEQTAQPMTTGDFSFNRTIAPQKTYYLGEIYTNNGHVSLSGRFSGASDYEVVFYKLDSFGYISNTYTWINRTGTNEAMNNTWYIPGGPGTYEVYLANWDSNGYRLNASGKFHWG